MNPNKTMTPPVSPAGFDAEDFCRQVDCENRESNRLECPPGRGRYHRTNCTDADAHELRTIANRPPPGLRLYKYGSRSVVGSYELQTGLDVCLKYYFPNRLYKHLTYGIGGSRCLRSWMAALAFARAGIPTPAPLAIIEWKSFGGLWLEQGFLATLAVKGIPLSDFAETHRADPIRLSRVAAKLREHFSTMAHHRIAHGDLKATNILVDENDRISFVDLDAASVPASPSRWKELRGKDERIFAGNWRNEPALAEVFGAVLETP